MLDSLEFIIQDMKTNEGKEMKKFIEVQTLISKELKKIKDKKVIKPEGGEQ